MTNKQLTQNDLDEIVKQLIGEVNKIIATYGFVGVAGLILVFGVTLLATTFLPWLFVVLALVLGVIYYLNRR